MLLFHRPSRRYTLVNLNGNTGRKRQSSTSRMMVKVILSSGLRETGFLYLNPFLEAHKKAVVIHLTKRKANACDGKELVRGDRQG